MFLELEVVPLHLLILFEASISAQFLLPTFEQICSGITDCITKELQLPTFATSSLRQLGFLPLSLQLICPLSKDLIQSENKICLPPKALKLFWVIFFSSYKHWKFHSGGRKRSIYLFYLFGMSSPGAHGTSQKRKLPGVSECSQWLFWQCLQQIPEQLYLQPDALPKQRHLFSKPTQKNKSNAACHTYFIKNTKYLTKYRHNKTSRVYHICTRHYRLASCTVFLQMTEKSSISTNLRCIGIRGNSLKSHEPEEGEAYTHGYSLSWGPEKSHCKSKDHETLLPIFKTIRNG